MGEKIEYIKNLINELNNASNLYYNKGTSFLSDKEFDDKLEELKQLEQETGIVFSNSPTINVGFSTLSELKKINISDKPMLSLDKAHSAEDVIKVLDGYDLIASIKCDGLSIRLIYKDGQLISANTRGDGYIGQDVTEHIKYFTNVPLHINKKEIYVIDGEAIIYDIDFDYVNRNDEYANSRNLAAGSLSLLDMSIVKERRLSFIAWDVIKGGMAKEIHYNLEEAEDLGFTVVPAQIIDCTKIEKEEIDKVNKYLIEIAEIKGIPTDGVVWKINDIDFGEAKGQTAKFFNNAIAWKPEQEEYKTYLKNIQYDVSRNGILTPVAVFEPIKIDGSVVEKASLHNISIMKEVLGETPYYGEPIWVYKANFIIPQISRAEKLNYGDILAGGGVTVGLGGDYGVLCPICGSLTSIIKSKTGVEVLYCENEECPGKLAQRLDHYLGKKGLDVHGISLATLHKLIDWGWINELRDVYHLREHREEWINKPGFGKASVDKILDAIDLSKNEVNLVNFIAGLGIPFVGKTIAKEIVKYYDTWGEFRAAVHGDWTVFEGFGPEIDKAINNFDYLEADDVAYHYLKFAAPQSNEVLTQVSAIKDKKFCATGKLKNYSRDSLKADIESYGGRMVNSVTSATDYLITNTPDSGTQKNRDAQKLGVKIITEEDYENLKK